MGNVSRAKQVIKALQDRALQAQLLLSRARPAAKHVSQRRPPPCR